MLSNLFFYKYFLKWDDLKNKDEEYYLYTMHLEPEAVVLYWGDGLYKNQIKLIENIAAQLPPNNYLYVKDHVGFYGERDWKDFARLNKIPNIRVVDPRIPAIRLIKKAKGVLSINGTSTFEGIVLNKHVYIFGNVFYMNYPKVHKISNIKSLREELYKNEKIKYKDDEDLYKFIDSYLKALHKGDIRMFYHIDIINKAKNNGIFEKNLLQIVIEVDKFISSYIK